MLKKPKIRNEKHRRFIASLPCCACGRPPPVQAAHIRHQGGGGMGMKPCDSRCVPLCCYCHQSQHETSEPKFWMDKLERAKDLANALWVMTGDEDRALEHIARFKCYS